MRGHSGWNYAPYKPLVFDSGDIYICRVAPGKEHVTLEWLPAQGGGAYKVYLRKRDDGDFACAGETEDTQFTLNGLEDGTDYEFYVEKGKLRSRVRLARTGEAVGTVVNYLHPEDGVYSFSGRALCSPSLLPHPTPALFSVSDH